MRRMMKSGCELVSQDIGGEKVMSRDCPEIRRPERQDPAMRDPRESGALVLGWRPTRERGARARRVLTGLTGFFDGISWASARRTRSSPGFPMGGLRPQSRTAPRSPGPSATPPCYVPARSSEDTAVGQRGGLTLDLDLNHDLDQPGLRVSGKWKELCHSAGVLAVKEWVTQSNPAGMGVADGRPAVADNGLASCVKGPCAGPGAWVTLEKTSV